MVQSKLINGFGILKAIGKVKLLNKRVPAYCEWEITHYCNMSCAWCSTLTAARNNADDLSSEQALDIIEQLSDLGTQMVHFSGGEPMLRKDLHALITRAKQKNMMVALTTNGSASSEAMEKVLHADMIRVSIDGTEKFHDEQREFKGAYKKAIKTIEFLISKGHKPQIVTFYTDESSYPMITELAKICQTLGIQMILNIHVFNGEHGEKVKSYYGWKENDVGSMYLSALARLREEFGNAMANPEPFSSIVRSGGLDVYGCRAMDFAINIKADGSVCLPCTQFPQNIKKGDLKEIYYSPEADEIHHTQGKKPECNGCLMRCMGSASAMLNLNGQTALFNTYAKNLFFG